MHSGKRVLPGRRVTALIVLLTALSALPFGAALAHGPAVDQAVPGACNSNDFPGFALPQQPLRQDFTPTVVGIAGVDLCLNILSPLPGFTVSLREGTVAAPGDEVASTFVTNLTPGEFRYFHVDFAGPGQQVPTIADGRRYVIEIPVPPDGQLSFQWRHTCPTVGPCPADRYENGTSNVNAGGDFGFRTYPLNPGDLTGLLSAPRVTCPTQAIGSREGFAAVVTNPSSSAVGPFNSALFLSPDENVTTDDLPLENGSQRVEGLGAGESVTLALPNAAIPSSAASGRAFLGLLVDIDDEVVEENPLNNAAVVPITVTACGDAQITGLALAVTEAQVGPGALTIPFDAIPVEDMPFGATATEAAQLRTSPIQGSPIQGSPIQGSPIQGSPLPFFLDQAPREVLERTLLIDIPISGGWERHVAGRIPGPIQSATLAQALALDPPIEVGIGDVDLGRSPLRLLTLGAIGSAGTTLSALAPSFDWCAAGPIVQCGAGGNLNPAVNTLIHLNLLGFPMEELPEIELAVATLSPQSPLATALLDRMSIRRTPFRTIRRDVLTDPARIVSCTEAQCPTLGQAEEIDAIVDTATLADLLDVTPDSALGDITLGDAIIGFVHPSALPWETFFPLHRLPIQDFSGSPAAHFRASFSNTGTSALVDPVVQVVGPPGFRVRPGTVRLSVPAAVPGQPAPDPELSYTPEGRPVFTFAVEAIVDDGLALTFDGAPGMVLGLFSSDVSVQGDDATGLKSATAPHQAVIRVTDTNFEPNDDGAAAGLPVLGADTLNYFHVSSATDVETWRIPVPQATGSIVQVWVRAPGDFDLMVWKDVEPSGASRRVDPVEDDGHAVNDTRGSVPQETLSDTPIQGSPIQGSPIQGSPIQGSPIQGSPIQGSPIQGSPIQGSPIQGSPIQGSPIQGSIEMVEFRTRTGEAGFYTVQASGYNGGSSTLPGVVSYSVTDPDVHPELATCTPRSYAGGAAGVIQPVPDDVTALILYNHKRTAEIHGATQALDVKAALDDLADETTLGVKGAVIPVDGDPQVTAAFAAWDAVPCDPAPANQVVAAISGLVSSLASGKTALDHVVIVGGDELIPHARVPDGATLSNEEDYVGALLEATAANNALVGSAAAGFFLSDDAYGLPEQVAWEDHTLSLPSVAVGRVVETPADVELAVAQFKLAGGTADRQTAVVTGYDFLCDGAQNVGTTLDALLGAANVDRTLECGGWTRDDALAKLPRDVMALNGHADHFRLLPPAGTALLDTGDIGGFSTDRRRISFSMGCHYGLNVSDSLNGSPTPAQAQRLIDWAQEHGRKAAILVGNAGFGYGDTESPALSEHLMTLFAQNLDGSVTAAQALLHGKHDYFTSMGLYGPYDEKVLGEAIFYGLPFYRLAPGASPPPPVPAPDLEADPATGLQSTSFSTGPTPVLGSGQSCPAGSECFVPHQGTNGIYYSVNGNAQFTNRRPAVPRLEREVTHPDVTAHGVLLASLESVDLAGVDPVFARAVVDLTSTEPEIQSQNVVFPTRNASITTALSASGRRQKLVLLPARFRGTGVNGDGDVVGSLTLHTRTAGKVLYSTSPNTVPPAIIQVLANRVGSNVSFAVKVKDDEASSLHALVLYRNPDGTWASLPLVLAGTDPATGVETWTGSAPLSGPEDDLEQAVVQVVDQAANVGVAALRGERLDISPDDTGDGLTITVTPEPGASGWIPSDAAVTVTGDEGVSFIYGLDGDAFVPYDPATGVSVTQEGPHTVLVQGSDGSSGERDFAIDKTGPSITIVTPQDGGTYTQDESVASQFLCSDAGSGVKTCDGPAALDTATLGGNTFTVNAEDFAGNTASKTHAYTVVRRLYRFEGFFSPVDEPPPALNPRRAGDTIPMKFRIFDRDVEITDTSVLVRVERHSISCSAPTDQAQWGATRTPVTSQPPFRYDQKNRQFVFNAETTKPLRGTCQRYVVVLNDGTEHDVFISFT